MKHEENVDDYKLKGHFSKTNQVYLFGKVIDQFIQKMTTPLR